MKIVKMGYSKSPWRLCDDDGKEMAVRRPFEHPILGWTMITDSISGDTKAKCLDEVLRVFEAMVTKSKKVD